MADIEFVDLDIYGTPALKQRVAELVSSELGGTRTADQILRVIDFDSGTTKVIGGFVGDQLASMNAFMRMRFEVGGATIAAYQSGFSATDLRHRGRGYWPKLMRFAEEQLAQQGGAFVFGYPNPASHPLFVKKLGYADWQLWNFRIATMPGIIKRSLNLAPPPLVRTVHPVMSDALEWKRRSDADHSVVEAAHEGSRAWGKRRIAHKFGLPIPYLEIGTIDLARGETLKPLLAAAARKAGARFVYLSVNPENQCFRLLKNGRYGQPIIVKALGDFDIARQIDFFGGMRDTF